MTYRSVCRCRPKNKRASVYFVLSRKNIPACPQSKEMITLTDFERQVPGKYVTCHWLQRVAIDLSDDSPPLEGTTYISAKICNKTPASLESQHKIHVHLSKYYLLDWSIHMKLMSKMI